MSGNGIDRGLTTGEPYGLFVWWVMQRYAEDKFSDQSVTKVIREEFPKRHLALGGRGMIQGIGHYRSYCRCHRKRMGIHSDVEAAEVLARIDGKMKTTQEA